MSENRHLDIEALLALRDGEGSAHARSHVEACADCRSELERLYQVRAELKALTTYRPPRDLWPRVAAGMRRRRTRRLQALSVAGLALAAALAGVIILDGSDAPSGDALPDSWSAEIESQDLGPVIVRSQELERLLDAYRPAERVYDAPTALATSVLEDRIALLDRMLVESRAVGADRETLRGLWSERVLTLEKLVGLQVVGGEGVWRTPAPEGGDRGVWR